MARNMIIRHVDSLIVLRENTEPPLDHEWDEFLSILARNWERFDRTKVFVRTPGGGPTPAQQSRLREVLRNKPILVAVVSESVFVRFLVSSIALLNRDIRTFAPDAVQEAYAHLRLTPQQRSLVESIVDEMAFDLY